MTGTAGEARKNLLAIFSNGLLRDVGRPAKTFIHQFCVDTRCRPEDLTEAMDDRDGWRKRNRGESALSLTMVMMISWIFFKNQMFEERKTKMNIFLYHAERNGWHLESIFTTRTWKFPSFSVLTLSLVWYWVWSIGNPVKIELVNNALLA